MIGYPHHPSNMYNLEMDIGHLDHICQVELKIHVYNSWIIRQHLYLVRIGTFNLIPKFISTTNQA